MKMRDRLRVERKDGKESDVVGEPEEER